MEIFRLIEADDAGGVRELLARDPAQAAAHDAQGVSALLRARYRWNDDADKKILPGKPADWKFEYTTPGPVIEVPIDFEFKDVPLP